MMDAISLYDVATALKVTHSGLSRSFKSFAKEFPSVWERVEAMEESTRGGSGGRTVVYSVDSLTLAAFLYWRDRRGRLPRFFGVKRCPLVSANCAAEKGEAA